MLVSHVTARFRSCSYVIDGELATEEWIGFGIVHCMGESGILIERCRIYLCGSDHWPESGAASGSKG